MFLPKFTKQFAQKFSIKPRSGVNMHRKLGGNIDLKKILCIKEKRVISKNLMLQYQNTIFQIKTKRSAYTLRKTVVTVRERHDGSITLWDSKDQALEYTMIKKLPDTRETSSKQLNQLVDAILIKQKRNPWESSAEELEETSCFYKPMGAV